MGYGVLADLVVVAHLAFIVFVAAGGLLVLGRPKLAWIHVPAAVWGVFMEYAGLICPLTPLEIALRLRAGEAGYAGGFIEHYVTPMLYPFGLTRGMQIGLGTMALAINIVVYWRVLTGRRRKPRIHHP